MTRRNPLGVFLAAWLVVLVATIGQAADEILKLVPDSSLGFVVVNKPAVVDAKLQKLGQHMQLPVPTLLARIKETSGIRDAMDERGTVGLVVLPPEGQTGMPAAILLIPVTDYGKFVAQCKPEGSEAGLTRVTFAETACWIRNLGGYAALTDIAHRASLEKTLQLSSTVPAALETWRGWLDENDAAAVMLPAGIKLLSAKVQEGIGVFKSTMAQVNEQAKQAAAALDIYGKIFQVAERECSAIGIGVLLDESNAIRASKRVRWIPGGKWALAAARLKPAEGNVLSGLPAGRFVVAAGGATPESVSEALIEFSADIMRAMPEVYGLSEEQIEKMPAASLEMMKATRSLAMVLGIGSQKATVYENMVGVMQVDDSPTYLNIYEKSLREYAEIIKNAKGPVVAPLAFERCELAGGPALQFTMQMPRLAEGQPPQTAPLVESMFGPGAKLVGWIAPANEHTVVFGYTNKEQLERTIRAIQQGAPDLVADADVSRTLAMLPPGANWLAVWSPAGTIEFANRVLSLVVPGGVESAPRIPEFPQTPPLGMAVSVAADELRGHMVVPAELLAALGRYVGKLRAMPESQGAEATSQD